MNVWRLHLNPSYKAYNHTKQELFDLCIKDQVIGVGWLGITIRTEDESLIRKQAYEAYKNDKPAGCYKAINAMRKMQVGDLIWTRYNGNYYLCKVNGRWSDQPNLEKYIPFDITNYVPVTWQEVGMADLVPGKIVSSFRPSAAVQMVYGVDDISAYMWNEYHHCNDYSCDKSKWDIWSLLNNESIEELVILYLQVEKHYFVYSSALKPTTRTYECRMVNSEGEFAFPQVKSGNESLNANDYMQAIREKENTKVFLFAASEKYVKNDDERFVYLTRKELEDFARKNKNVIHPLTRYWMGMCGFWQS